MQNFQRNVFFLGAVVCFGALGLMGAGAQQPVPQKPKSAGDEEPVAVTERAKIEKKVEAGAVTSEQFGNFRFPLINNKGEIAFVALSPSPTVKNGADQAVFVRKADGSWSVMRRGEKAVNMAEPVGTFGTMPSFNDSGDFTFIAEFDLPEGKAPSAAPAVDPLNPSAAPHEVPAMNKALYLRTAAGLKSLAKLGEEVPNMPSHFSGFANPSTNSKGVTAFIGTYSDPDGRGLFLIEQGKMRIVVRSGQRVGNGIEGSFSEHYYPTAINERNEVAFLGRIGDKSGIFISRPAGVDLLAMTDKSAPIPNTNFIGFGNRTPALNNKGEVVFVAFTNNADAQRALFIKTEGGAGPVKLVAKSGDKIGDTGYAFSDFLYPAVNTRGDIAFMGMYGGRNRGLFIKTAKGIEPIALLDQPIPGGKKEEVFNNFTQPSINDRGEVVFYAQMRDGNVGIFHRDEKGVLRVVARRGDKMPK
jgi:hypothetical protein